MTLITSKQVDEEISKETQAKLIMS